MLLALLLALPSYMQVYCQSLGLTAGRLAAGGTGLNRAYALPSQGSHNCVTVLMLVYLHANKNFTHGMQMYHMGGLKYTALLVLHATI